MSQKSSLRYIDAVVTAVDGETDAVHLFLAFSGRSGLINYFLPLYENTDVYGLEYGDKVKFLAPNFYYECNRKTHLANFFERDHSGDWCVNHNAYVRADFYNKRGKKLFSIPAIDIRELVDKRQRHEIDIIAAIFDDV